MKKLVLVMFALLSAEAFASKARVNSLIGADHLVDAQTTFQIPSHLNLLNPFLTFEMGTQGTDAEAGVMRKVGGGNLMLYVGHQNTTASVAQGDMRTVNSYTEQVNPIEILYGAGNMGFGVSISNSDNKAASTKETTVVGKWGMNFDKESWAWANVQLYSRAAKGAGAAKTEITPSPYLSGGVSMAMNTMRVFGRLDAGRGKYDASTASTNKDLNDLNIQAGVEDRSLRTNAADIYYGAKVAWAKRTYDSKDISNYQLPVFIGIEAPVFSWMTVRASASQNVLFGETKDETTTPTSKTDIPANTLVAAGLGFTHAGFTLDGSLTAAGNGNINGNQFMTQAALTYNF
ncbi:MAG: hypothetical protein AB7H97_18715 [Pseudobdellovibrionaceae bacterium]